jgi:hypothetical protein
MLNSINKLEIRMKSSRQQSEIEAAKALLKQKSEQLHNSLAEFKNLSTDHQRNLTSDSYC